MTTYAEWHEEENELTEDEYEALGDYLDNQHEKVTDEYDSDTVEKFRDAYRGYWANFTEFVEQVYRETYTIPEELDNYIDWDKVARDWQHDYWQSDNGHVFIAH